MLNDLTSKACIVEFIISNFYHFLGFLRTSSATFKKTIVNFLRTHCYEIGGDVFSLAELESCVIRGNLSRPQHPKPPFAQAPKKSNAHRAYALTRPDPRFNFILVRIYGCILSLSSLLMFLDSQCICIPITEYSYQIETGCGAHLNGRKGRGSTDVCIPVVFEGAPDS